MGKKVNVAVFGNDNVVEWKKYELNEAGDRISIVKEGAGYFMPKITNDSPLYFPRTKKYLLFGERQYKKVYFVNQKAKECFNFKTGVMSLPDLEQIERSIASTQLNQIGRPEINNPWQLNVLLLVTVVLLLLNLMR